MMKAKLRNYRQAPRKVRLVAGAIRGIKADQAMTKLSLLPKKAAFPMKKLLTSAISNAKDKGFSEKDLMVKEITVDKGITFKRYMPRARGRAAPIKKETSHVSIVLEEQSRIKNAKRKMQNENAKINSK